MFNQRKPRRFNYKTRLSDSKKEESDSDLKAKWDEMRGHTHRRKSFFTSMPMLIIFLVFVFVLIYVLNGYIK
ncbi:MAG: hypothetical protein ED556_09780 [Winogradskyella sp.]|uniref:hypothetical protein n=1 Tax=Winogradskyella sp. TaxID=1883156 RepID=UPI000F411AB6|nr:hypothetical protein [Winogradskyella sp.]RNC84864.1 MAG: hypothetical protein ED556_09780 [Winogradskyella sp.]